jgi:hypothetical protein
MIGEAALNSFSHRPFSSPIGFRDGIASIGILALDRQAGGQRRAN